MRKRRFTLVELLVVMVIITILAAIVIGTVGLGWLKSQRGAVQSELNQLKIALNEYQSDWGYYPRTAGNAVRMRRSFIYGTATAAGLQKPNKPSTTDWGEAWAHYYLDPQNFRYQFQAAVSAECVTDQWDQAYWYQCPGSMNEESFDLWSTGPDKQPGKAGVDDDGDGTTDERDERAVTSQNDDITNWKSN